MAPPPPGADASCPRTGLPGGGHAQKARQVSVCTTGNGWNTADTSVTNDRTTRRWAQMLEFIIVMLIVGAIAGYVARLLVPGPDPLSVAGTIVLGIVGSFVGGFLGYVLLDKDIEEGALQTSGIIGAVIGAVVLLLLYRSANQGRGRGRGRGRRRASRI